MPELPLVGEEFAGYRLVSVLGRGGMSIVFRAENPRLGNVIALKVLDPSLATDDIFRTRFLEESRIAASMNHPNVIPVHDTGSSGGLLYIAMRCVTGTDLRQLLRKCGRLAPDTAVFLLSQAARALDAAHRRGLVHRDVKPGNLLVERGSDGADPDHVYLADFGITKHFAGRTGLTSTGAFLGTVDYVAPEQVRGISVLGLADQYSLGCVLYECLTGRVPFEKDLDAAIIWAHVQGVPVRPTLLRPDLPPAVDELFARVLAKNPGDRYGTCRDFMTAAREALGPLAAPRFAGPGLGALALGGPGVGGPGVGGPGVGGPGLGGPGPGFAGHRPGGPEPAGYPAELAHEGADDCTASSASWPTVNGPVPRVPRVLPAVPTVPVPPVLPVPPALPAPPVPPVLPLPGGSGRATGGGGLGRRARRWRGRRPGWLVAVLALLLVAGTATGAGFGLTGGGGPSAASLRPAAQSALGAAMRATGSMSGASPGTSANPRTGSSPAMSMAPETGGCTSEQAGDGHNGPATLAAVLADANACSVPKGLIPAPKCTADPAPASEQVIVCTSPAAGISQATFRTYPTLAALYGAYTASVTSLAGSFTQNTRASCGETGATYAEAGWNHQELHPRQYTTAQLAAGQVPQLDAMGRLACFASGKSQDLVWTAGVGKMLAVAIGSGSAAALYNWWAAVHHVIIFPGTEMCGMSGRMESVPLGNLIQEPVCPAGAGMS